jgi:hypothetical protein
LFKKSLLKQGEQFIKPLPFVVRKRFNALELECCFVAN